MFFPIVKGVTISLIIVAEVLGLTGDCASPHPIIPVSVSIFTTVVSCDLE